MILRFCKGFFLTSVVILIALPPASAKKERERPAAVVVPYKLVLSPELHAGSLTGDAGKAAKAWNDNFSEKLVYGFGVGVDDFLTQKLSLGVQFGTTWKSISNADLGPVRVFTYSARLDYLLLAESKETLYGHLETGMASGRLLNYPHGSSTGLEKHLYLKLGAGLRGYTSAGTTTSFLLFYQVAFSKNTEVKDYGDTEIPFNVTLVGIELGFGFGLKKLQE